MESDSAFSVRFGKMDVSNSYSEQLLNLKMWKV